MTNEAMGTRLVKATKTMHNPQLDSTANAGGYSYKYASLQSILAVVRPALLEQDLMLTQGMRDGVLVTQIMDEQGDAITLDARPMTTGTNAQQLGSFETYMRRYALLTAFGLVGAEDDDGALTIEEVTPQQAQKAEDAAKEAGQELADAITVYCAALDMNPQAVRQNIIEKLTQSGEIQSPEAMKREAGNLHALVKSLKKEI